MNTIESHSAVLAEFAGMPGTVVDHLKPCIVGPDYQTVRYDVMSEKETGNLGEYDPDNDTCFDWPGLESGAVVDLTSPRLFVDDALLQYFNDPAGSLDTIKGTYCQTLDLWENSTVKNAIRSLTTNWVTSGAYARAAALYERDVAVGDVIKVSANVGVSEIVQWSTVAGFIAEKVAGVVGTATEDPNNISEEFEHGSSSSSAAPSIAFQTISGAVNLLAAAVTDNDRPDFAYEDGVVTDVYTIRCTEAGTVGVGTPKISVTSDSGTDDDSNVDVVAGNLPTPFGVKTVSVTFPNGAALTTDMEWEVTVNWGVADVDVVSGGTYTGPSDTTYIVEVTQGGSFAGGPPQITITSSTGIDNSGPTAVPHLNTAVAIGSYGVTLQFTSVLVAHQGLYLGDKFYVECTAATAGAVRTIKMNHNLPNALLGITGGVCGVPPDLSVTLYIQKDIEITEDRVGFAPLVNWAATSSEICVSDGVIAYDAEWRNAAGTLLPLSVKGGTQYVEYRALRTAGANVIGSISASGAQSVLADVEGVFGTDSVSATGSPLALGVYFALLNAGDQEVRYCSVATDDLVGYTAALGWIAGDDELFSIVPLTRLATVQALLKTHVDAYSTTAQNRWRRGLINILGVTETGIVTATNSGAPVLATISDDLTALGTQYTYVEIPSSGINLVTSGVQAGDILRAQYGDDGFGNMTYNEYVVSSVLSADSLLLVSGPDAPIVTAAKIEIWRNCTTTQQVTRLISDMSGYDDSRMIVVWPDYVTYAGTAIAGYYLCAAMAGCRASMAPQRSLTDCEILGFDAVPRTTLLLTDAQQDQLEAAGITVITALPTGEIYARRAVTTAVSELKYMDEGMTANADSIRYVIADSVAPFTGQSNLVDSVLNQILAEVIDALDFLQGQTQVVKLGAQVITYASPSVSRDSVLLNRCVVATSVTTPYPNDELSLQIVV